MSRPIKFMAWNKPTQKIFIVTSLIYDCDQGLTYVMEGDGYLHPIWDVELMQSTGLHDKNGKEIYEGDVLKVFSCAGAPSLTCLIFWDLKLGAWMGGKSLSLYLGRIHDIGEIIGNIYENPELLENLEQVDK